MLSYKLNYIYNKIIYKYRLAWFMSENLTSGQLTNITQIYQLKTQKWPIIIVMYFVYLHLNTIFKSSFQKRSIFVIFT